MSLARGRRPGLLGSVARTAVISGTARATSNVATLRTRSRRNQGAPAVETPHAEMPDAEIPAAPARGEQLADQLSRLAELRISGVLTDEEFAAAKARLLT